MGLFDDIFSGGKQAAAQRLGKGQQRAMEEYQGAWGDERGYLNPQLGGAFGNQDAMHAMLDPNQFYSNMMQGYEMSPAAQREMQAGEGAIGNAMAAQGMGGSSQAAQDASQYAHQFTSDDMQRYFQNQMGIFGQGMGAGQNLASYRDLMGQRMGQGRIGIGQADAMNALGRGSNTQQGLMAALAAAGGAYGVPGMGAGAAGTTGGLKGALAGLGRNYMSGFGNYGYGQQSGGGGGYGGGY